MASASEQSDHRDNQRKYRKELLDVDTQIDRLTDLLVNNHITADAYKRKHTRLQSRHTELTAHLKAQHVTVTETEQALIKLVRLMNSLGVVIKSSKNDVKRMMLKTLFSNLLLKGRNLQCEWVSGMWGCCNEGINQKWLWVQSFDNFSLNYNLI